ncbi:MAG: hypothetical protein PHQ86_02455 [Dehalococcoidales bacterium]|nr:hypothetical protein [Dehalococcoidales bacterium]
MKIKLISIACIFLLCWFGGSCATADNFDNHLNSIVSPYRFSIAEWELSAIFHEIGQWFFNKQEKISDEINMVKEYFNLNEQIEVLNMELEAIDTGNQQGNLPALEADRDILRGKRITLETKVENIIKKQVKETLNEQDIYNPIIDAKFNFPPVNFVFENPLYLLVISPRNEITSIKEILLAQNLSLEERGEIETAIDKLDVSSLVVKLGGLGATYPAIVSNKASLRFTINTVIEEWLHQYLAFKPLGFRYLLDLTGISKSYEISTINETLASMVSQEIGSIIWDKYYRDDESKQILIKEDEFDFNKEMKEIRQTVDIYLAQGEIERAEIYMEQKRQFLTTMGHYIRKLNQAYFAYYGTYADRPTSINPIGLELKGLRSQSDSLAEYLNDVAMLTSRQELIDKLD